MKQTNKELILELKKRIKEGRIKVENACSQLCDEEFFLEDCDDDNRLYEITFPYNYSEKEINEVVVCGGCGLKMKELFAMPAGEYFIKKQNYKKGDYICSPCYLKG